MQVLDAVKEENEKVIFHFRDGEGFLYHLLVDYIKGILDVSGSNPPCFFKTRIIGANVKKYPKKEKLIRHFFIFSQFLPIGEIIERCENFKYIYIVNKLIFPRQAKKQQIDSSFPKSAFKS